MTIQDTTAGEIREKIDQPSPVFEWGWPTEALLSDTTEMAKRVEQAQ